MLSAEQYIGDKDLVQDHLQTVERKLGQRHGGPMAPPKKDSYAKALQEQIAMRDARRCLEQCAADALDDALQLSAVDVDTQAKAVGKRCVPPAMPSKESYARELEDQIQARNARRKDEGSQLATMAAADVAFAEEAPAARGRRRGGPMMPVAKDTYALDLQEQI